MNTIHAIHYPCIPPDSNPYNILLLNALNKRGINSRECNSMAVLYRVILRRRATTIHFHWLNRAGGQISKNPAKLSWQSAIVFILLFSRAFGIRTVWTVHDLEAHNSSNNTFTFYRLVATLVNSLIAHSPAAVKIVASSYDVDLSKVHFIPHGLYPNALEVKARKDADHRPGQTKLRLVYFGNISPYKGLDTFASALQVASKQLGDLSPDVTIIGNLNNSRYPKLSTQLAEANELRIISDFMDCDSLNRCLEEADLVVLPFRHTLTSGSLIYALSAGKPVLVSRIDSIAYYLSPSYSFIFEAGNVTALAAQLVQICNNYSTHRLQCMGVSARRFAMTLDWSVIAKKTSNLYYLSDDNLVERPST
jgi:beta-1,4-mannosyltransferase